MEVFSPVCNDVTFRIVLVCVIIWDLDSLMFDVTTAFLTGHLEEEMHMECPQGMEHKDDEAPLLLKTICGLVQASRQHNKRRRKGAFWPALKRTMQAVVYD